MSDQTYARQERAKLATLRARGMNSSIDLIDQSDFTGRMFNLTACRIQSTSLTDACVAANGVLHQGGPLAATQPSTAAASVGTILIIDGSNVTSGLGVGLGAAFAYAPRPEWVSNETSHWTIWAQHAQKLLRPSDTTENVEASASAKLRVERLARIQAALGLPALLLADVLRISRPGLYKWLDVSKDIALQETSRERLAQMERLAAHWSERSRAPLGSAIHEPLGSGTSILQLLTQPAVDEAAVDRAFDEIAMKLKSKPDTLSQKLAEAGFTRRRTQMATPDDE